ncbi:MAG: hypothetical protein ACI8RZ_004129 [Myxococcota bacterium]|jgi:hypothetical protein
MGESASMGRTTTWKRGAVAIDGMYLLLASLLVQQHAYHINFSDAVALRAQRHIRLIALEGDAPWAYRLLVPAAAEAISIPLAALGIDADGAREYGYLSLRWVMTAALLLLFHRYCRRFLSVQWALTATLLLVALHAPAFMHYWFQPASPLDLLLWLMATMITLRGRNDWLPLIVFLGALNRETAVFIIAIHGILRLGHEPLPKLLLRCAGLGAIWAAVFVGLRQIITPQLWSTEKTVWEMFVRNLDVEWFFYALSFVGMWGLLPLLGWKKVPDVLKRLTLVMIPYVVLLMLFGRIREVRLLLPLTIPLIPAAFLVLQGWLAEDAMAEGAAEGAIDQLA